MARFDLDSYETVESRLTRFWEKYPEGRVLTDLVFHDDRRFVVKAEIYFDRVDMQPVATGYAEEIVGASPVNKTAALENCETSAIGRALANCGFVSTAGKRPSREEMDKVQRYEAEPRKQPKSKTKEKSFTPEDIAAAEAAADLALETTDLDNLRKMWLAATDVLDAPIVINGVGTTLKDIINGRASELQGAA